MLRLCRTPAVSQMHKTPDVKTLPKGSCASWLWRFVRRLGKRRLPEIGAHVSALRYCQWGCSSFSGIVIRSNDRVTLVRPDKRWTELPVDVEVWTHDVTPPPNAGSEPPRSNT